MMRKKNMSIFWLFLNCFAVFSCNMMHTTSAPLAGKLAIEAYSSDDCVVYMDSKQKAAFTLRNDNEVRYSGLIWLNTEDYFLGSETIPGKNRDEYRINIAKFNLSGKVIDRIYEAEKGEIAWVSYPSRDDKYLLFTIYRRVDPELYPFEGLTPMLTLKIMNLEQKKVIKSIDSIGRSPNFQIKESPWLQSGYQFVYSLDSATRLESEEGIINPVEVAEGIYVYDLRTHERKLLVPGGSSAIASPTTNEIAYKKGNSIRILDLITNKEKAVYEYGSREKIHDLHWTPDGKYIYFAYTYYWGISDLFHTGEKLLEASSGKAKSFDKIGHGFNSYTWK